MNTMETILFRQSCRDYTGEQIPEEALRTILTAANAAPVGMKTYDALHLSVIQNKAVLDQMEAAVLAARPDMPHKHPLYHAPTCILVSTKQAEPMVAAMHAQSAACVVENMLLAATELGLGSTYIMGAPLVMMQNAALCQAAGVPEGFAPVAMAAVGYSAVPMEKKEPKLDQFACTRV